MKVIKCEICGSEFEAQTISARFCSHSCKLANQRKRYRMRKEGLLPPPQYKEKKKVNQELVRLSIEAREHGMSYGKYVAMMEMGAR